MTTTQLPTRLYAGYAVRVRTVNCVEVCLNLGFGVSVNKLVVLEGIQTRDIPRRQRKEAKHCLIALVGGRNVLVHVDGGRRDGYLIGRVYLDRKVHGDPPGLTAPFGLDAPRLEVSSFYAWLSTKEFDVELVWEILKGHRNGG